MHSLKRFSSKQAKTANLNTQAGTLKVYPVYLALAVIAYAGIAFLQYSLKWDMLDCYLPWRYFAGESIQNGIFPFWNPYQHLGYPIHADLRSVFYPEAVIMGLFGGYSVYTLHFLFIFYLSLAGLGMYLLSGHFTRHHYARLAAGMVYLLSGFFVSHGQEMFGIIAATWIPFILHYFIRLQQQLHWDDLWKLAFFLFLQLSGGYQALSIMLLYLLLAIFTTQAIQFTVKKQWRNFRKLLTMNVALAAVVVISVSVLILTFLQVSPHIGRFGGTSLAEAQFMPFSPRSMISLLLPFAAVKDTAYFDTDLSMNNAYTGILFLALYILAWFRKKSIFENIFWVFGLICLFAAFGKYTPVREWLYDHVPLMNLFRMSAFFRYYFVISIILMGSAELGRLIEQPAGYFRKIALMIALAAIVIALLVLHARQFVDFETFNPLSFITGLSHTLGSSTRHEHMVVHGIIQLLLIVLLFAALVFVKKKGRGLLTVLIIFTVIEMTVAVHLNFHATVAGEHRPKELQETLRRMPEAFPLPDLSIPVKANRDLKAGMHPLWRNTNIFTKNVSADGFNSFRLDAFESFRLNQPLLFEASLENPVMFLTDQIKPISAIHDSLISPDVVWVQDSVYKIIHQLAGIRQAGDTLVLKRFDPNHIVCEVSSAEAQVLMLMQTYYPGWQVFLNGEPVPHFTANTLFISCLIPEGTHTVEFRYLNKVVKVAFYVSYLTFALIAFAIVFMTSKRLKGSRKAWITTGILFAGFVVMLAILLLRIITGDQKRMENYRQIQKHITQLNLLPESTLLVLNVDAPHMMQPFVDQNNYKALYQRFSRKSDILHLEESMKRLVKEHEINHLVFASYNLPHGLEAEEIIRKGFPNLAQSMADGKTEIKVFDRQQERKSLFQTLNDLEQAYPHWSGNLGLRDTLKSHSGSFSWPLDGGNPGSPALVVAFKDINVEEKFRIVASAKVWLSPGSDAALYLVVEREGKSIWRRTVRCSEMIAQHQAWTTVMLAAEPDIQPQADDVLKVFFWIEGDKALWLDDFGVEVYKGSK